MPNKSTLAKQIIANRKYLKMSQTALAEALGVTRGTIAFYESDKTNPSVYTLKKMADLFKCDLQIKFTKKKP